MGHKAMDQKVPTPLETYDWWNYAAPVVPPLWVIKKIQNTQCVVDWYNNFWSGEYSASFRYRTRPATQEEDEDGYLTHLLAGSPAPAADWLIRISDYPLPTAMEHFAAR